MVLSSCQRKQNARAERARDASTHAIYGAVYHAQYAVYCTLHTVNIHACTHVCRHLCRHVCAHVCRLVCGRGACPKPESVKMDATTDSSAVHATGPTRVWFTHVLRCVLRHVLEHALGPVLGDLLMCTPEYTHATHDAHSNVNPSCCRKHATQASERSTWDGSARCWAAKIVMCACRWWKC